ncbi:MAG: hypothetical protein AB7P02_28630 [Alphaproteobacteria bacterium]
MRGIGTGQHEAGAVARRAWLSGLLVWTLLVQMLVPMLGPLRLGDSAAMAGLGRLVPICTIEGLRLAEPATAEDQLPAPAVADAGWHCALCITPAVPAAHLELVATPADWVFAWAQAPPDAAPRSRPHSPHSARGPPAFS